MKKYFYFGLTVILAAALTLVGYGAYLNHTGEYQIAELMAGRVTNLKGDKAKIRSLSPRLSFNVVNFSADEMADAVAIINGRITESFVEKNDWVQAGDVMFTLIDENIPLQIQQAESAILKAEADLSNCVGIFQRQERMLAQSATSQEKYETALTNCRAAEAALKSAKAQRDQYLVQESRQKVTAPISGEVLIIYRQPGTFVTAGTSVALVGNFRRLTFSTPMNDKIARNLTVGSVGALTLHNNSDNHMRKAYDTDFAAGNAGKNQAYPLTVQEISPPLTESAAIRNVRWSLDNSTGMLEPHTYEGVKIFLSDARTALSVPINALRGTGRDMVFVLTADNTLEKRKVETGIDDGKYIEILSGLAEGETVITSGTANLAEDAKVTVTLPQDENL
ncbi:MAG: efflux RND transporter periplasmic adaptor subunit [Selenomonadaceae bacterium]|nr:efflux RND transporter periplasmic adaptor subunit [Selenomonadaceae bacterium]